MGKDAWYRNTTWDSEIESDFRKRLSRSRKKSQYLKIQAVTLVLSQPEVTLKLLDEYFQMEEDIFQAQAYAIQAEAYSVLNQPKKAVDSLRAALKIETIFPGVKTRAYIQLPLIIVQNEMNELNELARETLELNSSVPVFPVDVFLFNYAWAKLCLSNSNLAEAKRYARIALDAATKIDSGFHKHKKLGLVGPDQSAMKRKLEEIERM